MSAPVSTSVSVSSSAAAPSSTSVCTTTAFSEFPTKDSGCAVGGTSGVPSNYHDILSKCCKSAPVNSWANDCALYCLAVDQNIAALDKCFQDGGVKAGDIFCNGANNATATEKPSGTQSGGASSTGGATKSAGSSGAAASGSNTPGAAGTVVMPGVSKAGIGMLAMVLGSVVLGAFV